MAFIIKPRVLTESEYPLITESQRACETNYEGEKKASLGFCVVNKKGRFHVTVCKSCRAPREARGWYFH